MSRSRPPAPLLPSATPGRSRGPGRGVRTAARQPLPDAGFRGTPRGTASWPTSDPFVKQGPFMSEPEFIAVKGAREHNLKSVSLQIPKKKLVVFTGVSGSGKSSLAFDTLYAEGQRRYVESLSSYARQF